MMTAREFAKTHPCDPDWVAAMGDTPVVILTAGTQGTYAGYPATVVGHYHNGRYDVRLPAGIACIDGSAFVLDESQKYVVTFRSKTTFKTDQEIIEVWPGQTAELVAERIADGYGATVELLEPAKN